MTCLTRSGRRRVSLLATAGLVTTLTLAPATWAGADDPSTPPTGAVYTPRGTAYEGGPQPISAVRAEPGDYLLDMSPPPGADVSSVYQYFKVPVRVGERVHVSATAFRLGPGGGDGQVGAEVEQIGKDGSSCLRDSPSEYSGGGSGPAVTAAIVTGRAQRADQCFDRGYVLVKVARSGDVQKDGAAPVELVVRVESAKRAETVTHPPKADVDFPVITRADESSAERVDPGLGYGTAPLLEPGRTYTAATKGGLHLYRVRLQAGQRMAVAVKMGQGFDGQGAGLGFAAPDRMRVFVADDTNDEALDRSAYSISVGESLLAAMRSAVDPASDIQPREPGDYYVLFWAGVEGAALPYSIKVGVGGTPVAGPEEVSDPATLPGSPTQTWTATPTTTPGAPDGAGRGSLSGVGGGVLPWVLGGLGAALTLAGAWIIARR